MVIVSDLSNFYNDDIVKFVKSKFNKPIILIDYEGKEITEITIPEGTTTIDDEALYNCSSLTTLTIPSSVTSIGERAFYGCSGLTSVTIPSSVTSIGEGAFANCSGMKTLKLPDKLQIIKKGTFNGCSGLNSISIPANVEFIYQEAFAKCANLKEVIALPENPPFLYNNSFSNYDITLKASENALEAYTTTEPWSNFSTFKTVTGADLVKKCEKPTINVVDGKLKFSCVTEDVEYNWSITTNNGTSGKGNSVPFAQTFIVSVFATRSGYENSDVTTQEFTGSGLSGDVDGNGVVNVADHVKLSEIIMNQ